MARRVSSFEDETKVKLRGKQLIFLHVLSQARGPLTRDVLCRRAKAHPTNVTLNALGSNNPETRAKREEYPSLLTLGYVTSKFIDLEGGRRELVYEITPEGRQALIDDDVEEN